VDQQKIQRLESTKNVLAELAEDIQQGHYPVGMLDDFKESVDHMRTTIWTMMKLEEERGGGTGGSEFNLGQKLVEYRLRRARKLLQQTQMDIDVSEIDIQTPGIAEFQATVDSLHERLNRLIRSGG
jgi:hypothetical protein